MANFIDLTGQKFSRLVVLKRVYKKNNTRTFWECECSCGNKTVVEGANLKNGNTKSCGCINKEKIGAVNKTHGKARTPLYNVYLSMKARCNNQKDQAYKNYGMKGIIVCKEWSDDFLMFYNWAINNGYRKGLTIDRIDNSGDYTPSNCRWVTMQTQQNNRSNNILIYYKGEKRRIRHVADELGVSYNYIVNRYHRDYTKERERAKELRTKDVYKG